jgi:transposase-like protein
MTRAVVEMYLQAVSTRRITAIFEELRGLKITSRQVCRATAERA